VVTNGGGLGIVSTDAAREAGLEVVPLADPVHRRLEAVLPPTASLVNPVDLVGDADAARYGNALHAIGPDAADAVIVVLTAQASTDAAGVARAVVGATRGWGIPVVAAFVGGGRVAPGARALEDAGIPCYPFPEPAVKSLAGMATLVARRGRHHDPTRVAVDGDGARRHLARLAAAGRTSLGMLDLLPVLEPAGIPCTSVREAATAEEAAAVARRAERRARRHAIALDVEVEELEAFGC